MSEPSSASESRRAYDSPARRRQAAQTRARIVDAGVDLAHGFATWDWRDLTFRAVAERAGVGERTVYRHFPSERHLHDAVMQRLEEDAGISYENVDLDNLAEVTARVFASLQRFAVGDSVRTPGGPTFAGVDERRKNALLRAVSAAAPQWSEAQCHAVAGLLDALWHLPTYERLVGRWEVPAADATSAITWLMAKVMAAITDDDPPPPGA